MKGVNMNKKYSLIKFKQQIGEFEVNDMGIYENKWIKNKSYLEIVKHFYNDHIEPSDYFGEDVFECPDGCTYTIDGFTDLSKNEANWLEKSSIAYKINT